MHSRRPLSRAVSTRVLPRLRAEGLGVFLAPLLRVLNGLPDPRRTVPSVLGGGLCPVALDTETHRPSDLGAVGACVLRAVLVPLRTVRLGFVRVYRATLRVSIRSVVGVRAQEQVPRVDARRIVAAMADKHPVGDWAEVQLPRDAMRRPGPATDVDVSVAPLVMGACGPYPAAIAPYHLLKESLGKRLSHTVKLTPFTGRVNAILLAGAP